MFQPYLGWLWLVKFEFPMLGMGSNSNHHPTTHSRSSLGCWTKVDHFDLSIFMYIYIYISFYYVLLTDLSAMDSRRTIKWNDKCSDCFTKKSMKPRSPAVIRTTPHRLGGNVSTGWNFKVETKHSFNLSLISANAKQRHSEGAWRQEQWWTWSNPSQQNDLPCCLSSRHLGRLIMSTATVQIHSKVLGWTVWPTEAHQGAWRASLKT